MDLSGQDRVSAFDGLFTNNQIQKLKILMPYLDRSMQKNLAIYIKYLELRHTMNFFNQPQTPDTASPFRAPSFDLGELCNAMHPYCTTYEQNNLNNILNMLQSFEQYKEMMEMVQMMQEMFPEGGENSDMTQMLNLFQTMFHASENTDLPK